jgi:3,4-dihydroxy 2-butanone 4-phosphate synthase/GTP cyclohydrolase II
VVELAIARIAAGGLILVLDDSGREIEGDLVLAAKHADAEKINFLVTHGRGLVCVPMTTDSLDRLSIPPMPSTAGDPSGIAWTISVDARADTSTGVSAGDRAATARALADPRSVPADFVRPGHLFPLGARSGGVLERPGHTEAAVDLARLAGLEPAGVICGVMAADGSMARRSELEAFARVHRLPIVRIADLIAYRAAREHVAVAAPDHEMSAA